MIKTMSHKMRWLFIGLFLLFLTTNAWSKEKKWKDDPCYKNCMIEMGWCFKKFGEEVLIDTCFNSYYEEDMKNDKSRCMSICLGRSND